MGAISDKEMISGTEVPTPQEEKEKRDEYFETLLKLIDSFPRRRLFKLHKESIAKKKGSAPDVQYQDLPLR
jgi:hypothetical protein